MKTPEQRIAELEAQVLEAAEVIAKLAITTNKTFKAVQGALKRLDEAQYRTDRNIQRLADGLEILAGRR